MLHIQESVRHSGWASFIVRLTPVLRAMAWGLVLILCMPSSSFPQASNARADAHVYLFRGFMNVFSLGMDGLAQEFNRRGIPASVYNHMAWSSVADEAAQNYKLGRTHTIIAIGHSSGADAVATFVERLGNAGVPVALAVALDDGSSLTLNSGRVGKFVNLYISGGVLGGGIYHKGPRFSGPLINIDLAKQANVGHMNIDKTPVIQRMVIGYVNEAVGKGRAASSSFGRPGSGASASPAGSQAPAAGTPSAEGKAAEAH